MENSVEKLSKIMDENLHGKTPMDTSDVDLICDKILVGWPNLDRNLIHQYSALLLIINMMGEEKSKVTYDGKEVSAEIIHELSMHFREKFVPIFPTNLGEFVGKSMAISALVYKNREKIRELDKK